jgi:acyl-CoA hydrolase
MPGPGDTSPRPAAASESLLVRWMGLTDANSAGFVHGGTVMKLCDETAGIAAVRHCGGRVVTAAVRVEAENPRTGAARHTSTAYLTMVAVDESGRPAPVPPLEVDSEDERRRQREAELRRANRLAEREQIISERTAQPTTHRA